MTSIADKYPLVHSTYLLWLQNGITSRIRTYPTVADIFDYGQSNDMQNLSKTNIRHYIQGLHTNSTQIVSDHYTQMLSKMKNRKNKKNGKELNRKSDIKEKDVEYKSETKVNINDIPHELHLEGKKNISNETSNSSSYDDSHSISPQNYRFRSKFNHHGIKRKSYLNRRRMRKIKSLINLQRNAAVNVTNDKSNINGLLNHSKSMQNMMKKEKENPYLSKTKNRKYMNKKALPAILSSSDTSDSENNNIVISKKSKKKNGNYKKNALKKNKTVQTLNKNNKKESKSKPKRKPRRKSKKKMTEINNVPKMSDLSIGSPFKNIVIEDEISKENNKEWRAQMIAKENRTRCGCKLHTNHRYRLDDGRIGRCTFVGTTLFGKTSEKWVGFTVEVGDGEHNGRVQGKTYFRCRDGKGIMVRPRAIIEDLGIITKKLTKEIIADSDAVIAVKIIQHQKKERKNKSKNKNKSKQENVSSYEEMRRKLRENRSVGTLDSNSDWKPPEWVNTEEDHGYDFLQSHNFYPKKKLALPYQEKASNSSTENV